MNVNFDEIKRISRVLHPYRDQMADLTAVFSFNNSETLHLIFNTDQPPKIPVNTIQIATLADFSPQQLDIADTLIISFADVIALKWPRIFYPRGSKFYPLEHLLAELGRQEIVQSTKLNLAYTLFGDLDIEDELPFQGATAWLKQISRLFSLSLPALLKRHPDPDLLAIIPAKNFDDYLFSFEYRLVYVEDVANAALETIPIDTGRQLCAAYDELSTFHDGIDTTQAGFLDLRKVMRRNADTAVINKTIRPFAAYCTSTPQYTNLARTLTAEYWLSDQELDGLIGVAFPADPEKAIRSGPVHYYYLTLPASKQNSDQFSSLSTINNVNFDVPTHIFSLPSVRSLLRMSEEQAWMPLNTVLLKLGQKQTLAKNTFLTSRRLKNCSGDSRLSLAEIANEAAFACDAFSLANRWQWPHGNYETYQTTSYENLFAILDKLAVQESNLSPYYESLGLWWRFDTESENGTCQDAREQAAEIIKRLIPIIETKLQSTVQAFPEIVRLFVMAQAMRDLLTPGTHPIAVRDNLIAGGFTWILGDKVVRQRDEFNPHINRLQPSPLFLTALGKFLDLAEQAHNIRVNNENRTKKIKRLIQIGQVAGKQSGIDFDALLNHEIGGLSSDTTAPTNKPPLFMMPHEQAWLNSVYSTMLDDYAKLIVNLRKRPPITWQITPDQITRYAPTIIRLIPTHQDGNLLVGLEITLINSASYRNLDKISRKVTNDGGFVEFDNVSFNKTGAIPIFFHYKYDDKNLREERWVQVVGLDEAFTQKRNPYAYGDVIRHPHRFYGLRTELQTFISELRRSTQDERQNYHLWGMRRSGKTSLLYMIEQIIKQPEVRRYFHIPEEWDDALDQWHPLSYSLQEVPESPDKLIKSAFFFQALIRCLCDSLQWKLNQTETLLANMRDNIANYGEVSAAKTALQSILAALPSTQQIVVLLDEFDLILGQGDMSLFGHFRSIILDPELTRITWIIASWRGLYDDQKNLYESPFFNILRKVSPRPLIPEEARRQVLEQARTADIYFLPEAVDYVLEQTGRQPYFLQATCSHIVNYMNQKRLTHISRHTAEKALDDLLRPGSDLFDQCQYLWEPVPEHGKLLLCWLAQGGDIPSNKKLRRMAKKAKRPVDKQSDESLTQMKEQVAKARENLLKTILIIEDKGGSYQFAIPLLRRWLKREQHLDRLSLSLMWDLLKKRKDKQA